ncbi:MAG TPA: hypothetical protein PLS58_00635 [Bacteroidales bacterium]|jgi:phage tail protein X|nr:hypothetical protein [Bacteroidales bacterium]
MKTAPERSDFEILLADWLAGNLDPRQEEVLKTFLEQNPGLAATLPELKQVNLRPPDISYAKKDVLKKSPGSISEEQFVVMCIADLENDLSAGQLEELDNIISNDDNRRKTFELIKRLKVRPQPAVFRRKSSVIKLTAGQRIFRYSLAGLGMAAMVALLITVRLLVSPSAEVIKNHTTSPLTAESGTSAGHNAVNEEKSLITGSRSNQQAETGSKTDEGKIADKKPPADQTVKETNDESSRAIPASRPAPPAPLAAGITLIPVAPPDPNSQILRKFNPSNLVPEYPVHRSNVDRLLARLVHGFIKNDTLPGDRPVKSFDLAIAGITGINRLLGWDMTLDRITDEKGELRSYYFSSGLLKFNAPAKKP